MIPFGKANVVQPGDDVTVVTYGATVHRAVQAQRGLKDHGVTAEIIDLRSLSPVDWDTIGASVHKTGHVVVLEQGGLTNSYGAMLTDEVQRRLFDYLDHPVARIYGGESSPSVSKVLERSAFVGEEEIGQAFAKMVEDKGIVSV